MPAMSHQLDRAPTGRTAAQLDRTATGPWAKTTSRPQAEAVALYYPAVVDHAMLRDQTFVSGCMYKSSVQSFNIQSAPIFLSSHQAFWTVPHAALHFLRQAIFSYKVQHLEHNFPHMWFGDLLDRLERRFLTLFLPACRFKTKSFHQHKTFYFCDSRKVYGNDVFLRF